MEGVVSGTITSFNDATGNITLQLIPEGTSEPAYEVIVKGNTVDYSFTNVELGTYTLKVSKANHVTREYTVVVGDTFILQDVKIHLLGDINGDGKVNLSDVFIMKSIIAGSVEPTEIQSLVGNLNADGKINLADIYLLKVLVIA